MPWEPNRLSPCHGQKDGYRHDLCPKDKPVCKQWVCSVDKDFLERQADLHAEPEPEPTLETRTKTCGRHSVQNKGEGMDKDERTRRKKTCGRHSVQNKGEGMDKDEGTRRKKTCGRHSVINKSSALIKLKNMGFEEDMAKTALEASNGNLKMAINILSDDRTARGSMKSNRKQRIKSKKHKTRKKRKSKKRKPRSRKSKTKRRR